MMIAFNVRCHLKYSRPNRTRGHRIANGCIPKYALTMKISTLIGIACLCSVGTTLGVPQAKKVERVPATPSRSLEGADLFLEYCAVCHGKDAKGGGPAAEALKKAPADLTQISRRNGGQFPTIKVQQIVK